MIVWYVYSSPIERTAEETEDLVGFFLCSGTVANPILQLKHHGDIRQGLRFHLHPRQTLTHCVPGFYVISSQRECFELVRTTQQSLSPPTSNSTTSGGGGWNNRHAKIK
jgi:hypothetical protein